jgi:hypothetical protein
MQSTKTGRVFLWSGFWYFPDGTAQLSEGLGAKDVLWGTCDGTAMYCFMVSNSLATGLDPGEISFAAQLQMQVLSAVLSNTSSGVITFAASLQMQILQAGLSFVDVDELKISEVTSMMESYSFTDKRGDNKLTQEQFTITGVGSDALTKRIPVVPIYGTFAAPKIQFRGRNLPAGVVKEILSVTELSIVQDVNFNTVFSHEYLSLTEQQVAPVKTGGQQFNIDFNATLQMQHLIADIGLEITPPQNPSAFVTGGPNQIDWTMGMSGMKTQIWRAGLQFSEYYFIDVAGIDVERYYDWSGPDVWFKLRHEDPANPLHVSEFTTEFQVIT